MNSQQLVEQLGHRMVEELRAVVAVKAENAEGELMQHGFQDRNQVAFGNRLDTAHHLPLRDRVDGVDVVQAGMAIEVALMHGVHAEIVRLAAWIGLAPFGN